VKEPSSGFAFGDSAPVDLSGSVAVVTGGGRGVGRAIARSLADAGAAVAVVARNEKELEEAAESIRQRGGEATPLPADVTDPASVDRLARETERRLGPVDILVNNAGACRAIGPVWEAGVDDWRQDVESSLLGAFLCTRAFLAKMVERRFGRIINVSSYAAIRATPHMAAYGCAKAALLHFTNSVAAETADHGICVFALTPGRVRTAMTKHMVESSAGQRWLDTDMRDSLPAERAGELAVLLAGGRADALTGRFVHVLDDVHDLIRRVDEIRQDDLYVLRLRK
jgi:NAD(P)-dependent dehydrogenase (short-subunit alcohol dehydrogenase family)